MSTFTLEVAYAQLAVFDSRLATPFNDWSETHVSQGFSWRSGSVSFATLEPNGLITVSVMRSGADRANGASIARAIRVAFSVPVHGELEIATTSGSAPMQLPAGEYALTFRHGRSGDGAMWAALAFEPVALPVAFGNPGDPARRRDDDPAGAASHGRRPGVSVRIQGAGTLE